MTTLQNSFYRGSQQTHYWDQRHIQIVPILHYSTNPAHLQFLQMCETYINLWIYIFRFHNKYFINPPLFQYIILL